MPNRAADPGIPPRDRFHSVSTPLPLLKRSFKPQKNAAADHRPAAVPSKTSPNLHM
jgi:hypothetical protein